MQTSEACETILKRPQQINYDHDEKPYEQLDDVKFAELGIKGTWFGEVTPSDATKMEGIIIREMQDDLIEMEHILGTAEEDRTFQIEAKSRDRRKIQQKMNRVPMNAPGALNAMTASVSRGNTISAFFSKSENLTQNSTVSV